MQPSDWRFESGVHGKPALVDPPAPLTFNVSHSRERLACAVALDLPLGVDLEYRHPDRELMRVARRYFQREEVKVLESLPEQS
ncbi:MAG: 4'-phosphopantetheinyl transferase, partial [Myxococcota bacterium]